MLADALQQQVECCWLSASSLRTNMLEEGQVSALSAPQSKQRELVSG